MTQVRKIKVLIVDDSLLFREMLAQKLAQDIFIEVVATAADPYMARDKILEFEPNVMILDVEMPRMNGIQFLRKLLPQYPLATVVVSALGENIFDALDAGAVDFVTKPDFRGGQKVSAFINELIIKIKIASSAKLSIRKEQTASAAAAFGAGVARDHCIIAIGASTGGTEAIAALLKALPPSMPGIVIVQHMPAGFTAMYAKRLNTLCSFDVREAKTGDLIKPGHILIAPGDYHMRVKRVNREYSVECFRGERVNGHCPSVDVLFESVARTADRHAIGVILTGMGYDGASGLLSMKKSGARTIGQDEASSIVYGMPKVAFNIGAVEKQASLANIPKEICSLLV